MLPGLFNYRGTGIQPTIAGTVNVFANLPAASLYTDKLYAVTTASGTIFINRKAAGVYRSDGSNWIYVADFTEHDQASEIDNDSSVSGDTVKDALNTIYTGYVLVGDTAHRLSVGTTTPSSPVTGDLWVDPSASVYGDEEAQDAVGGILVDSASIDFTYNDGTPSITATVLPAGVDHNSLANLTTGDPHTQYLLNTNSLTADTPVAGDFIPFYDISGSDNNKVTLADFMKAGHIAFDPKVAHVKADGTGTHATIAAANSDSAVTVILVYPGTHTIDNSVSTMTLAKQMIGLGGRHATTLERTDGTRAAIQITAGVREFGGFTISPQGTSADAHWLFYNSSAASRSLIKDINCRASNGIKVRNSLGLIIERISAANIGVDFPNNPILVGDASGVPTNLIIRDCVLNTVNNYSIDVYGGNVDIVDCGFSFSGFGAGIGVRIQATATGNVTTKTCVFSGVYYPIVADLSGGAKYTTVGDAYDTHLGDAISVTGGAGTLTLIAPIINYDPIGYGNSKYSAAAGTTVVGFYPDVYTGDMIVLRDVTTITGATTITNESGNILCNSTSAFTVTLPTAASYAGRDLTIKNINTGVITIDGNGAETIDGSATLTLATQWSSATLYSTGTSWIIL